MNPKYMNLSVSTLNLILEKLNNIKVKVIRNKNKKIFRIDKILSVNTRNCKYVGGKNNIENKIHLQIKFTSPDENGIICISILLENYDDLIQ